MVLLLFFFCMQHMFLNGFTSSLFSFILPRVLHIQCFPAFSPHDLLPPSPWNSAGALQIYSQVPSPRGSSCYLVWICWPEVGHSCLSNPRTDIDKQNYTPSSKSTGFPCPCRVNCLLRLLSMQAGRHHLPQITLPAPTGFLGWQFSNGLN